MRNYLKRLTALTLSITVLMSVFLFARPKAAYAEPINIVIDPAHGGTDYGGTSVGGLEYQEKALTFKLAQYLQYELRKYKGASINMTRYADYHMTSVERAEYAQRVGGDIVISLHFNSSEDRTVHGASATVSSITEYSRPEFAAAILTEISKLGIDTSAGVGYKVSASGNMWIDGQRPADFSAIMRECAFRGIPLVSIDHCYLSCYDELIYYNNDIALRNLAKADADAIAAQCGLVPAGTGEAAGRTYDKAYMNGYDDGTFRPSGTITRAEAATMLAKLSDGFDPNTVYSTGLSDVPTWAWYYNYVAYLNSVGFVTGDVFGAYRPDDNMTKAEFAILACRYLGLQPGGESGFADCSGHMADGYIAALRNNGYVGGDENGEFHPNEDMLRSSVVMMMNRILGRYPVCSTPKENPFWDIQPDFWAYDNILEAAVSHEVE